MEFNVTIGPSGSTIERDFLKENSMILIIVFITTTLLELFMLIGTCVYYRKRITGLLKEKKVVELLDNEDMKEGVEMRTKSFDNRKSMAVSLFRYVMDPTSLKQAEKYIYDYITSAELDITQRSGEEPEELNDTLQTESETNALSQTREQIMVASEQDDTCAKTNAPLTTESETNGISESQTVLMSSFQDEKSRAKTNATLKTESEANDLSKAPGKIRKSPSQEEGVRAKTCDKSAKGKQKTPIPIQKFPQNQKQGNKSRQKINMIKDKPLNGASGNDLTSDENRQEESTMQNKSRLDKTNPKMLNTEFHLSGSDCSETIKQDDESCTRNHNLDEKETDQRLHDTTYDNHAYSNVDFHTQTEVEDQPLYMNFRLDKETISETTLKTEIDPDELNNRKSNGSDGSTDSGGSEESYVSRHETNYSQTNERTNVQIVLNIGNFNGNLNLGSSN